MAISVIKEPGTVALVRNPVGFRLQTNNYILDEGSASVVEFELNGDMLDGETITFAWNGNSVTFTAVDAISVDDGLSFRTNLYGDYMDDWAQVTIIPALLSNYLLNEDFIIEISENGASAIKISLTSRKKGSQYNLNISHTVTVGWGGTGLPINGYEETRNPNFSFYLDVYVEEIFNSGSFSRAVALHAEPDALNQANFEIGKILRAYLSPDLPTFNQATVSICSNILKQYYLRYAEAYGDPITVKKLENAQLDKKLALLAGFGWKDFPTNTFAADYITTTSGRKFLTQQPREKSVSATQQEFLYYYSDRVSGTLTLKAKVYYTDGTSATHDVLTKTGGLIKQVYIFPAGYAQLGIGALNAAKTVDFYELWVVHTSTHYSETFTYNVHPFHSANNRYFLYLNSLGGMDTLWCRGEEELGIQLSSEEAERIIPFDYTLNDIPFFDVEISYRDELQINTGWKSKEYILALREFLISELIYEITPTAFVPVKIERKGMALYTSEDRKYALSFNISSAYQNKAFSR